MIRQNIRSMNLKSLQNGDSAPFLGFAKTGLYNHFKYTRESYTWIFWKNLAVILFAFTRHVGVMSSP